MAAPLPPKPDGRYGRPRGPDHAEATISSQPTYLEAFLDAVQQRNDLPLFTFLEDGLGEGVTWTYGELDLEARRIAAQLVAAGAVGAPVLLMAPPGLEYLAGFYGCMYAGAIAVPAYPPSPMHGRDNMERLQAVADDAGVATGLTTTSLLPVVEGFAVAGKPLQWLSIPPEGPDPDPDVAPPQLGPDDIAFLQYTSGSTGDPKGVMVSQSNLLANTRMIDHAYEPYRQIMVSWLPPYHDMGLIGSLLTAPINDMHTIFMPPAVFLRRPVRWLQVISRVGAQITVAPNFAYEACIKKVKDADLSELDLSTVRIAINGAEPVRPSTVERFTERFAACGFRAEAMKPSYGLAETTLLSSAAPSTGPRIVDVDTEALKNGVLQAPSDGGASHRMVTSGVPSIGTEVYIVDQHSGEKLPDGQVGEIVVVGPHVTKGYWRAPATTAERFDGDSLRTGDLGCLLDGELVVTGRIKDVLIIRGRNYYPQDIELTVESSNPTFRRGSGVAFSIDENGSELLVVVQEATPGLIDDPAEVVEQIRRAITVAHAITASGVVLVRPGGVPTTSSGKVRRSEAKRLYENDLLTPIVSWRAGGSAPDG